MINSMFTVIINNTFKDIAPFKEEEVLSIEQCLFTALSLEAPYPYAELCLKDTPVNQQVLCLTPMSFAVGMRDVFVQTMPEQLNVTECEHKQIVELLMPLMTDVNLLLLSDKNRLYLKTDRHINTTPYFELNQTSIKNSLPKGKEHAFWNRLLSECQMALSQAPFNLLRNAESKPLINALWVWGEGRWAFSDTPITFITDNVFLMNRLSKIKSVTLLSVADFLNLTSTKHLQNVVIYLSKTTVLIEKKINQLNKKHAIKRVWKNGQYTLSRKKMFSNIFRKKLI